MSFSKLINSFEASFSTAALNAGSIEILNFDLDLDTLETLINHKSRAVNLIEIRRKYLAASKKGEIVIILFSFLLVGTTDRIKQLPLVKDKLVIFENVFKNVHYSGTTGSQINIKTLTPNRIMAALSDVMDAITGCVPRDLMVVKPTVDKAYRFYFNFPACYIYAIKDSSIRNFWMAFNICGMSMFSKQVSPARNSFDKRKIAEGSVKYFTIAMKATHIPLAAREKGAAQIENLDIAEYREDICYKEFYTIVSSLLDLDYEPDFVEEESEEVIPSSSNHRRLNR